MHPGEKVLYSSGLQKEESATQAYRSLIRHTTACWADSVMERLRTARV